MAASHPFARPGAKPSRPTRRFTLEEANRALPLVSRIVADIVKAHAIAAEQREMLETAPTREHAAIQASLGASVDRIQDLLDELNDVGAELKDFETGLIDFVGRHDGRDAYLCWKLGEEKVSHWHELTAGFAGRKPASQLKEKK